MRRLIPAAAAGALLAASLGLRGAPSSPTDADAEKTLTQAIQADPARAQAYFDRGCARVRMGKHAEARADLDKWIEYDPKYALVRADLDLLLFSDEREARRRQEEAAARAAEEERSFLAAFRHYAVAYALTVDEAGEERLADALIGAWKRCTPRPGYPMALVRFLAQGQAHARARRHEEAAIAYRQAARFCPWCAEAHYNQALILGEYRRYGQAATAMRRAREILPDGPEAQEAEGMLLTWELLGE